MRPNNNSPEGVVAADQKNPSQVGDGSKINMQHIDSTDWSITALPIGVKIKGVEDFWVGASPTDLKILASLLLKPLTLVTVNGIVRCPPVADESDFLTKLGKWAEGAAVWCVNNPTKIP